MATAIFVLFGMVFGALFACVFMAVGKRRRRRLHERDPIYAAARFAADSHLRKDGTLTVATMRYVLQIPHMTVDRYMGQMEREGLIRKHGHDAGAFYTRG